MFDSHIHTDFSTDSRMSLIDALETCKESGINMIITEHMDLKYPKPKSFVFNPDEYLQTFNKYKSDSLLLGIELGMRLDCVNECKNIEKNHDFDFVLGSVHMVDGIDIYYEDLYNDRNKKDAYSLYLKCMYDCVKSYTFIDSLGHIDYIARYARYEDKELYYDEFSDLIDPILKLLVSMDKSIEINTRRFTDKSVIPNLLRIYRRFNELGGTMVTIGSDSHSTDTIGRGISEAKEIAEKCGLRIVYYKNRKPHYDK